MTQQTSSFYPDFGDDWEPDGHAVVAITQYLLRAPEQGDWDWQDHCEGLAGGILHQLHGHGMDIVHRHD